MLFLLKSLSHTVNNLFGIESPQLAECGVCPYPLAAILYKDILIPFQHLFAKRCQIQGSYQCVVNVYPLILESLCFIVILIHPDATEIDEASNVQKE